MTARLFRIILLSAVIMAHANSAHPRSQSITDSLKDDARQFRNTSRYIYETPMRLGPEGWAATGMFGTTVFLLAQQKRDIHEAFRDMRSDDSDDAADFLKTPGEAFILPAATVLLYSGGLLLDQPRERKLGLMMFESLLYTGSFTLLGQYVFSEERPMHGGKLSFFETDGHGISGHTSMVAAVAGPINATYLKIADSDPTGLKALKITGKIITYGFPVATGWSRINDDKHYLWNVMLGLGLGYTFGELAANAQDGPKFAASRYMPTPGVAYLPGDGLALTLSWEW